MLKDNGRKKAFKKIKCCDCGNKISLIPSDIIEDENGKTYICSICYAEIKIKK